MNSFTALKASAIVTGALIAGTALAVPTYVVDSGKLTGINDIDIAGLGKWNVAFAEGTPLSVYGNPINLAFTNQADAVAATDALKAAFAGNAGQSGWDIDLQPHLTYGCSIVSNFDYCAIMTPFELTFNTYLSAFVTTNAVFENLPGEFDLTLPTINQTDMGYDTTPFGDRVFAVWSRPASVPEPGTLTLLAMSLLLFGISRRKSSL